MCAFLVLKTGSHIEFTIAHSSVCIPNYKFSERSTSVRIALRCVLRPNVAPVSLPEQMAGTSSPSSPIDGLESTVANVEREKLFSDSSFSFAGREALAASRSYREKKVRSLPSHPALTSLTWQCVAPFTPPPLCPPTGTPLLFSSSSLVISIITPIVHHVQPG